MLSRSASGVLLASGVEGRRGQLLVGEGFLQPLEITFCSGIRSPSKRRLPWRSGG